MRIFRWTQPPGGAAVDHYEVWGQEHPTASPVFILASRTDEGRLYENFSWPSMDLMVRAVSVNGVAGAFSNTFAYTKFDPDLSASEWEKGIVRLASYAETIAGEDATSVVTPAALKSA